MQLPHVVAYLNLTCVVFFSLHALVGVKWQRRRWKNFEEFRDACVSFMVFLAKHLQEIILQLCCLSKLRGVDVTHRSAVLFT